MVDTSVAMGALEDRFGVANSTSPSAEDSVGETTIDMPPRRSQASLLTEIGEECRLWHTPTGEGYATAQVDGHVEHMLIRSEGFETFLAGKFWRQHRQAASGPSLSAAVQALEADARFSGPEHSVHLRVAQTDSHLYVDLGQGDWSLVEVGAEGWRILTADAAPVRFRRPANMLSLPTPKTGGSLDPLGHFVNVGSAGDWRLLVAWAVSCFFPSGPHPILVVYGQQGSAKSTLMKALRSLIDPNAAPLRSQPRTEVDLLVAAKHSSVIALENVSSLGQWLSDALCRLSTGAGMARRALYTDDDETVMEAQRPIMMNGIEEFATRGDLLDRALVVHLPPLTESTMRTESDFWSEFEDARCGIFAGILDALVGTLRALPSVELPAAPRMADFAKRGVALESALGWPQGSFLDAYRGSRRGAVRAALESSPVALALMEISLEEPYNGTATDLLRRLEFETNHGDRPNWPKGAHVLSNQLRRLAPGLRTEGIFVDFTRSGSTRSIRISKLAEPAVATVTNVNLPRHTGLPVDQPDDAGLSSGDANDDETATKVATAPGHVSLALPDADDSNDAGDGVMQPLFDGKDVGEV